jgi:tellurite resistance protein TerC
MFLVLMMIEASDLVFAVGSIPAIFAVTTDPFIVFTSNIFAIMGLRALYFLLADTAERFHLLKYGPAPVLVFIGGKMLMAPWFHMPVQWSLAIVGSVCWGPRFLLAKSKVAASETFCAHRFRYRAALRSTAPVAESEARAEVAPSSSPLADKLRSGQRA